MIRILHVLGGLGYGGTENVIMNWYRSIDRSRFQFDFLIRSGDMAFGDEITKLGGRIYQAPSFPRHACSNYAYTKRLLQSGQWDIVHVHANAAIYLGALAAAKHCGVRCVILHSHNVRAKRVSLNLLHRFNRLRLPGLTTVRIACSEPAGRWMFGKQRFLVMNNGIETDCFRFRAEQRAAVRKQLGLGDSYVVGNVGRFVEQKNHQFLLKIFSELRNLIPNSKLLLVGDGELRRQTEAEAKRMDLDADVVFAGNRNDVAACLSAMDVFVFPSKYEGLGIALVEAQLCGLPCVVSREIISGNNLLSDDVILRSLQEPPAEWARSTADCRGKPRAEIPEQVRLLHDRAAITHQLEDLYSKELWGGRS